MLHRIKTASQSALKLAWKFRKFSGRLVKRAGKRQGYTLDGYLAHARMDSEGRKLTTSIVDLNSVCLFIYSGNPPSPRPTGDAWPDYAFVPMEGFTRDTFSPFTETEVSEPFTLEDKDYVDLDIYKPIYWAVMDGDSDAKVESPGYWYSYSPPTEGNRYVSLGHVDSKDGRIKDIYLKDEVLLLKSWHFPGNDPYSDKKPIRMVLSHSYLKALFGVGLDDRYRREALYVLGVSSLDKGTNCMQSFGRYGDMGYCVFSATTEPMFLGLANTEVIFWAYQLSTMDNQYTFTFTAQRFVTSQLKFKEMEEYAPSIVNHPISCIYRDSMRFYYIANRFNYPELIDPMLSVSFQHDDESVERMEIRNLSCSLIRRSPQGIVEHPLILGKDSGGNYVKVLYTDRSAYTPLSFPGILGSGDNPDQIPLDSILVAVSYRVVSGAPKERGIHAVVHLTGTVKDGDKEIPLKYTIGVGFVTDGSGVLYIPIDWVMPGLRDEFGILAKMGESVASGDYQSSIVMGGFSGIGGDLKTRIATFPIVESLATEEEAVTYHSLWAEYPNESSSVACFMRIVWNRKTKTHNSDKSALLFIVNEKVVEVKPGEVGFSYYRAPEGTIDGGESAAFFQPWRTTQKWSTVGGEDEIYFTAFKHPDGGAQSKVLVRLEVSSMSFHIVRDFSSESTWGAVSCYYKRNGDTPPCIVLSQRTQNDRSGWVDISKDDGKTWQRFFEGKSVPDYGLYFMGNRLWNPGYGEAFE